MYYIGSTPNSLVRFCGTFRGVANIDDFYQEIDPQAPKEKTGIERFMFEARCMIDRIDPNICDFMANFKLSAQPNGNIQFSQKTIERLNGAPEEFLMALVRHIDFSDATPEVAERNIRTLAGFVAQRFTAISLVAHGKKSNNETTSFHPARHEAVLSNNAQAMAKTGHDTELCRKIFSDFMEAGCRIQDAYINDLDDGYSPIAVKLSSCGITPLVRTFA